LARLTWRQSCQHRLLSGAGRRWSTVAMNAFDKLCAALAFVLGIVFLVLGVIGLFTGCRANFTLPPVLGVIPAIVGWGIVRAVYFAWNSPNQPPGASSGEPCAPVDRPRD
jgi:hypothetical protein